MRNTLNNMIIIWQNIKWKLRVYPVVINSRHLFLTFLCMTVIAFFLIGASTTVYAQSHTIVSEESACEKTKAVVRETALQQGVSQSVMSIESLRHKGNTIVTHYTVTSPAETIPSRLIQALIKKQARNGFFVQAQIVSEKRVLITVSTDGRPCVEILCILSTPLSTSFHEQIKSLASKEQETAITPKKQVNDDSPFLTKDTDAEESSVIPAPAQEEAPATTTNEMPNSDSDTTSLISAIIALKTRLEPELSPSSPDTAISLPSAQELQEEESEAAANKNDHDSDIHTETIEQHDANTPAASFTQERPDLDELHESIDREADAQSDPSAIVEPNLTNAQEEIVEEVEAETASQQQKLTIPDESIYEIEGETVIPQKQQEQTLLESPVDKMPEVDAEAVLPKTHQGAAGIITEDKTSTAKHLSDAVAQQKVSPIIPGDSNAPDNAKETEEELGAPQTYGETQAETIEYLKPGKIALILDDGGYGGETTARVLALDNRITLSILPDTPCATSTAKNAIEKGFEIMVHMPMQASALSQIHLFPGELRLDMTKKDIQKRTHECLKQFPDAVGVNNHTGGAFTVDEERTGWFLDVVKQYNIFFVDSRTNWNSCAYHIAKEKNIPCDRRNIFLDNTTDLEEIRAYLKELAKRSRTQGTLIGIGHFRPNTITVLEEELPKLKNINIELVRVSEVVQ